MLINVIYDRWVDYTTGHYIEDAFLTLKHEVVHSIPGAEIADADFYFRVDDGGASGGKRVSPSAYWAIDTCHGPARTKQIGKQYDQVYELVPSLMHHHMPFVHHLPLAADPIHISPIPLNPFTFKERPFLFGFIGSLPHDRQQFFKRIEDTLILRLLKHKIKNYYSTGLKTDIATIYSNSWFCLNPAVTNSGNMRTYEALAAGAILLQKQHPDQPTTPLLDNTFTPEEDFFPWSNTEELTTKIVELIDQPDRLFAIATRSQQHVINNHLYVHRMAKVLKDFNL
jgi:hypothetical protein